MLSVATPLVLGSASPRRRDLVAILGVPFVVCSAAVDESALPGEAPDAYVVRVTRAKLEAVRSRAPAPAGGVLVADTIVIAPDGVLLGKPLDDEEGRSMIQRLAGATHLVSTHFVLARLASGGDGIAHAQTVTTGVRFRALAT